MEKLNKLSAEKFNSMIGYTKDDIDNWLVEYANRNEDIETTLQNLSIDYRKYENELFKIKVKLEVIISPLRQYTEEWLKRALIKIIKGPTEAVDISHITTKNKDIKGASTSK
jgi:hypothetical protein